MATTSGRTLVGGKRSSFWMCKRPVGPEQRPLRFSPPGFVRLVTRGRPAQTTLRYRPPGFVRLVTPGRPAQTTLRFSPLGFVRLVNLGRPAQTTLRFSPLGVGQLSPLFSQPARPWASPGREHVLRLAWLHPNPMARAYCTRRGALRFQTTLMGVRGANGQRCLWLGALGQRGRLGDPVQKIRHRLVVRHAPPVDQEGGGTAELEPPGLGRVGVHPGRHLG